MRTAESSLPSMIWGLPSISICRSKILIIFFISNVIISSLGFVPPGTFLARAEVPEEVILTIIPTRPPNAMTGTQFALKTAGMKGRERQEAARQELRNGNIPDFLRKLKPIRLHFQPAKGQALEALVWVTPDYLAIGSDEDFLRIPLTYPSAVMVSNAFDCIPPTRKIVDNVREQATCILEPETMPPGPRMRSSEYYLEHQRRIRAAREAAGCRLGDLTAGVKKDVVLTNRLFEKPGRIAIYGWFRKSGRPIQPLSIVHGYRYADYSHGLRLVSRTVWIKGEPRSALEVLADPMLAPLLTYEGLIARIGDLLKPR